METLGLIAGGIFLILCIICAFKESKIVGTYKYFKVFGRLKAYLAIDLAFGGVACFVMGIGSLFAETKQLMYIPVGLACAAIGVLLIRSTYQKCPKFLKHRCILDMVIVTLGISLKIAVFFIVAVWTWQAPKAVELTDGRQIYICHDGTAYDPTTDRCGRYDPSTGRVRFKKGS